MKFEKEGFLIPPLDNDVQYFTLLESVVNSVDVNAVGVIMKTPRAHIFRITVSDVQYVNPLVSSISEYNRYVNLFINYSKSMKKNGNISFSIPIFAENN
jgi:hypothetical protein